MAQMFQTGKRMWLESPNFLESDKTTEKIVARFIF